MGVPVITPARRPARWPRAAASLLTTLGCPQWIAHSKVDYVRIAKTPSQRFAATEPHPFEPAGGDGKQPLRQPQRFAEQVETALRGMWAARS